MNQNDTHSNPPSRSTLYEFRQNLSLVAQESLTYDRLAQYIDANYQSIIFMTATELSKHTQVSQASVTRFCVALGFDGYSDFLQYLQKMIKVEITAPQRLNNIRNDRHQTSDIIDSEIQNIEALKAIVKEPIYEELVERIVSAKEIVLLSSRLSETLLPYFSYVLKKIRDGIEVVTNNDPSWELLPLRKPHRTLIFTLAFPRYPSDLIDKIRELKDAGFSIVAVTDKVVSPVTNLSDLVVTVPLTKSSIFDIYGAPIIFLNLLLRDVAKRIKGLSIRLDKLEQLEQTHGVYYSNEH
ncbi:MurR/RpiR family transcriptional regulator [Sporolactobacillus sp. STCC-11]|uniref:MurR/RpiR family transcriptional regulator n=1 Tax=Sporolactobacillus caesalpiniae TaxID=3230362 RepID=UPI0033933AD5